MAKLDRKKVLLVGLASLLLTFLQVEGWQRSMKYGTSMHTLPIFQKIGVLDGWQCVLWGVIEWVLISMILYGFFTFLENRSNKAITEAPSKGMKYIWPIATAVIFVLYVVWLIGCYPGYYNYDGGNQLVQVMYDETPYSTHHPLLHTLYVGGVITLGYKIYSVDLSFGIFLYCLSQMALCALCFGYSVRFIWQYTQKKIYPILAIIFYAICPPIVMFAMSTTKDTSCYAILLVAVIRLYELYKADAEGRRVSKTSWIITAILLTLSCLLRNNIVYAIAVLMVFFVIGCIKNKKTGFVVLFISVILMNSLVSTGLEKALHATPGSMTEALSVPFQQIARLYADEGESAFTDEELELLYAAIEPEMIRQYNPMISDVIKFAFWRHLDVIKENLWDFVSLWARKGLQYPKSYIDSFLDNTYQAWYPETVLNAMGQHRYFMITGWNEESGTPKLQGLYDYYASLNDTDSYAKYPVLRWFFSIGAMFWMLLITLFYVLWRKDKVMLKTLALVLLVSMTNLLGPVSDVRYYLILFYLFPICVGILGKQSWEMV